MLHYPLTISANTWTVIGYIRHRWFAFRFRLLLITCHIIFTMLGMLLHPAIWTFRIIQCCPHLALRRLLALSSQCSDTVSSSCSRAMAFSTDGWGARPTPWSMSRLMVSRVRVAGWVLACCTPSSQRACSSRSLRRGNSGSSTSKSKLTSKRPWISATLGTSSARTFSLCCWKSSMRFRSS